MPAFAGMTNMSASFRRHSGESRNPEHHSKTKHLILNEYNFLFVLWRFQINNRKLSVVKCKVGCAYRFTDRGER